MTNLPLVTRMEMIAIAAAALFLFATPILFAFGDARRRRQERALQAASVALPATALASEPLFSEPTADGSILPPALPASDESSEGGWIPIPPQPSAVQDAQPTSVLVRLGDHGHFPRQHPAVLLADVQNGDPGRKESPLDRSQLREDA